ncbi:hypothetical protein DERP_010693 [Dermatophagoides pteronyssinus]|uniref:Uncharacterized protein n=1 Tax=Dermatophagoides pteronyssinus TaxID=6956 RepID=A0ABQ8JA64_DERPT|nr:hypothetical protein DERP_010693 [Dermatophagoides pteronyssinus]
MEKSSTTNSSSTSSSTILDDSIKKQSVLQSTDDYDDNIDRSEIVHHSTNDNDATENLPQSSSSSSPQLPLPAPEIIDESLNPTTNWNPKEEKNVPDKKRRRRSENTLQSNCLVVVAVENDFLFLYFGWNAMSQR